MRSLELFLAVVISGACARPVRLHVSKALDIPPNEVALFDDSLECVNGAVEMHGQHCVGFGALQIRLSELGILTGGTRYPWQG